MRRSTAALSQTQKEPLHGLSAVGGSITPVRAPQRSQSEGMLPLIKAVDDDDNAIGGDADNAAEGLLNMDRSTRAEMDRLDALSPGKAASGAAAAEPRLPSRPKVLPPLVVTQTAEALLDFEKALPVALKTKVHEQTISPARNSLGERTRRSALEGNKDAEALAAIGPRFSFHFENRSEKWERLRGKQKLEGIPSQIAEM